jgi:hypothetical protein
MLSKLAVAEIASEQFNHQLAQWRRQLVFLRSQLFFNGRVLSGPAPWPDKLQRIQSRAKSDALALAYDSSDMRMQFYEQTLEKIDEPWSAPWCSALLSSRGACLDGLLELGRECS